MRQHVLKKLNALVKSIADKNSAENKPIVHKGGILANDWEVKKLGKNNYCIICKNTILVKDIELYEVAYNVAYLINKGYTLSSGNITEILKYHSTFSEKFYEAIFCKERRNIYAKESDWLKYDVMDAKYKQARMLAVEAKKKLRKSYQNR
jgi:hypothetical protein